MRKILCLVAFASASAAAEPCRNPTSVVFKSSVIPREVVLHDRNFFPYYEHMSPAVEANMKQFTKLFPGYQSDVARWRVFALKTAHLGVAEIEFERWFLTMSKALTLTEKVNLREFIRDYYRSVATLYFKWHIEGQARVADKAREAAYLATEKFRNLVAKTDPFFLPAFCLTWN